MDMALKMVAMLTRSTVLGMLRDRIVLLTEDILLRLHMFLRTVDVLKLLRIRVVLLDRDALSGLEVLLLDRSILRHLRRNFGPLFQFDVGSHRLKVDVRKAVTGSLPILFAIPGSESLVNNHILLRDIPGITRFTSNHWRSLLRRDNMNRIRRLLLNLGTW